MEKVCRQTIVRFYWLSVIAESGAGIIAAMYVIFLLSRDLDLFEVNLVNAAFFVTLTLAEVPTGLIADLYGRRLSCVIAYGLLAIGMGVYAASAGFWGFVLAEVISAVGRTFWSGAFDAWLVDRLKHHQYVGGLHQIFARQEQFKRVTGIVFALIGALIASYSMALVWAIGAGLFAVAGILAYYWMSEEYRLVQVDSLKSRWQQVGQITRDSLNFCTSSKAIRFILVMGTAQMLAMQALNMFWQPRFKQFLPQQAYLGLIWTGIAVATLLGAQFGLVLLRYLKSEKWSLICCQLAIALAVMLAGYFEAGVLVLSAFMAHEFWRGTFRPIKMAYLHEQIQSPDKRATIASFDSLAHHAGGAIGLVSSGWWANQHGIASAWFYSGMVLILLTLLVIKNGQRKG